MTTEIETQDSNPEEEQDLNLENESDDSSDDLEKTKKAYESQKIRAEKAEKELKALKAKAEKTETPRKSEKSDESDYATKLAIRAFLNSRDIKHSDDQEYIMKEAKLMNRNPDEILEMEHVKSHLKQASDKREVADGMPKGGGKGGGSAADSVEHWIAKGELPKDQELAEKVVEAKIKAETSKNTFSDIMYVG